MYMRRCDRLHLLKRSFEVAIVKFVVTADVNDRTTERSVCPLHAPSFHTDVPCQNNHISTRRRRREIFEFGM